MIAASDEFRTSVQLPVKHNATAKRRIAAGGFEWYVTACRCGKYGGKRDCGTEREARSAAARHNGTTT